MSIRKKAFSYDVVVAGGGLAGVCAALASARHGAHTALVQNRPMFGGNASSEIRMHIVGASAHASKKNLAETGILMELLLKNKRRNPYASFPVFDTVLWEALREQENLDFYLNTNVDDVVKTENVIRKIICHQITTETQLTISGKIFIDATGHGTLGVLAGAACRMGSEGRAELDEPSAPEVPNRNLMGNSLMFCAVDRGEPVNFIKPDWAYTFTEEDLKYRHHDNSCTSHEDGGATVEFDEHANRLPHFSNIDSGYWWVELGGDYNDIIEDAENIRDELLRCVYGVWDHLKNGGDHGAQNLDLDWVGIVPGYRESRRLEGDYILTENDIRANRVFSDAVAYGGWAMDIHTPGGLHDLDRQPSNVLNFEGAYTIPYRCYYSRNVENLMMAGRDISASKMAFSSVRVMGTCAIGGQAVGTAAAMAVHYGCTPRELGKVHIKELQQTLLKDDCYIPGFVNEDKADLARYAAVSATSAAESCEPQNVCNGIAREQEGMKNCWQSGPLKKQGESITLAFAHPGDIREIRLVFDPDLNRELMPSLTRIVRERQVKGMPPQLVKNFTMEYLLAGQVVHRETVTNNVQRLCIVKSRTPVHCDSVRITVTATYGAPFARIFEIRAYA